MRVDYIDKIRYKLLYRLIFNFFKYIWNFRLIYMIVVYVFLVGVKIEECKEKNIGREK